jgi:hypothetical protein
MFGNKRELSIRVQKADKPNTTETHIIHDRTIDRMTRQIPKVLVGGALFVYGYVLLDTYRQTTVADHLYNRNV